MTRDLADRVAEVVREVAAREIVPRYRTLAAGDVLSKATASDPHDVVTAADLEAERALARVLPDLVPGSLFVGEEACAARPELLEGFGALCTADGPDVWIVDPVDGTRNFAAGQPGFGTMVALLRRGQLVASWIHLTLDDVMFVAEAGAGTTRNGVRVRAPGAARPDAGAPAMTLYATHMPAAMRERVMAAAASGAVRSLASPGCAALEYTDVAMGHKDAVIFHRLLPWDHAPGALIVREAGGVVRHPDGDRIDYAPATLARPTLAATSDAMWRHAAARLGWPVG